MKALTAILLCLSAGGLVKAQVAFTWVPWNKVTAKVKAELKTVKVDKNTTLYSQVIKYKKEGASDEDLNVAVLDMDKDGKKEYALSNMNSAYCGSLGCSLEVYKDGGKMQIHLTDEIESVKPAENGVISTSGKLIKFE